MSRLPLNQPHWRDVLRQSFNRVEKLADFLELSLQQREKLANHPKFPILVPHRLANKMKKGTLDDPINRQFLPLRGEGSEASGFLSDPVCDASFQEEGKLLKKYHGRVLLLVSGACAMHCRYCFRQNYDYESSKIFQQEIEWIRNHTTIREVILSGGDPLSVSDEVLDFLLKSFNRMTHIKRIRFHTRFPIGIPERIDGSFLEVLAKVDKEIYFVVHSNHHLELDEDVLAAFKKLKRVGCTLLNQTVLLRGVNDDVGTLNALFERLVDHGVIPYYLHQLDQVKGSESFEVEEPYGKELIVKLARLLPGYALPKYVREIPNQPNKTALI